MWELQLQVHRWVFLTSSINLFDRFRRVVWLEGKRVVAAGGPFRPYRSYPPTSIIDQFGAAKLGGSHTSAEPRAAEKKLQEGLFRPHFWIATWPRGKRAVDVTTGGPHR